MTTQTVTTSYAAYEAARAYRLETMETTRPAQKAYHAAPKVDIDVDYIVDLSSKSQPHSNQTTPKPDIEARVAQVARDIARNREAADAKPASEPAPEIQAPDSYVPRPRFEGDFQVENLGASNFNNGVYADASQSQVTALLNSYFTGRSMEFFKIYRQITVEA